jgi:hypothetical protein
MVGMKVYDTLNVSLTFQNCGSVWLMVLRGSQEEIEQAFNGLFNFNATSGQLEYTSLERNVATFWTKPARMRQFFYNRHILKFESDKHANIYADMQMAELVKHSHVFKDFHRGMVLSDVFAIGTACAERPDHDFRDAVLLHAHSEKEVAQTEQAA